MNDTATRMDAIEIADFMENQRTGVLSLASDDDAYAVPVSFAYDADGPSVYLRLGYAPGSQKRRFVDATEHVSFVVYDRADGRWKSVVARGRLEELSEDNLDAAVVEAVERLDIPFFRVFDRPADDLEFTITRIRVSEISGLVAAE